jgi:hypothetical protein
MRCGVGGRDGCQRGAVEARCGNDQLNEGHDGFGAMIDRGGNNSWPGTGVMNSRRKSAI